jgi:N-acetylmuramoyl-L-alanine amidase
MNHLSRSIVFIASALLLSPVIVRSQPKKVLVKIEQQEPVAVRALDSLGVTYVSMTDFATKFGLPAGRNDIVHKYEIRFAGQRIKFTSNSPFIVITELSTNSSSVYLSPQGVLRKDTVFYAPLSVFPNLFDKLAPTFVSRDTSFSRADSIASMAPQFDIAGIEVETRLNGYLLTVLANRKLGNIELLPVDNQHWLYLTVEGAKVDTVALKNAKTGGAIKEIRVFPYPTGVQLTFRVAPDVVSSDVSVDSSSNNLLVALRTESKTEQKDLERKKKDLLEKRNKDLIENRSRFKLDVIVLDAGHGGKDPGTIGVTKVYEKNVALGVTLKLGALIEKNLKGVRVVYTRKTDKFVELYRRSKIANEDSGKIFISIHCNSMPKKPSRANGFEIYLLRPEKTERAIEIASVENAVIKLEENYEQRYAKVRLTAEDFILVTMAQSAYVKYSEKFAEVASESMAASLKIKNSGVKQAGFLVLVGASMPNVLVETGYLSNKKEEKFLASKSGQLKIAEALFKAIKEFKMVYERTLQEGTSNKQVGSIQ